MSAWKVQLARAIRPESYATLLSRNINQSALKSTRWRRVSRGYYVPAAAGLITVTSDDPDRADSVRLSTAQRILDATSLMSPGSALGTWAAAYVLGVDWLDGLDPHTMAEQKVVLIAADLRRRSTAAVSYRRSRLAGPDTIVRDQVRITSPARTAFDGTRWATSLEEAVVFLDSMIAFGAVSAPQLLAYAVSHQAWTGVEQAERATALARRGVRSGWETRARMCWRFDAGLPDPLVNVPIFGPSEELLGIADLFDPRSGLVGEFDGGQHRGAEQHRRDNIREEKLESANLVVVRCDKTDVRSHRKELVARWQDGHRRGQRRDRSLDRWTLEQPYWWRRQHQ